MVASQVFIPSLVNPFKHEFMTIPFCDLKYWSIQHILTNMKAQQSRIEDGTGRISLIHCHGDHWGIFMHRDQVYSLLLALQDFQCTPSWSRYNTNSTLHFYILSVHSSFYASGSWENWLAIAPCKIAAHRARRRVEESCGGIHAFHLHKRPHAAMCCK